jgi:putative peptidoglycan lipid II flippase
MATSPSAPQRSPQISTKLSIGKAAILISAMIALSRVAGFGCIVLISYLYGISPITNAYNAALNFPDTVNILISGGALATGFVPAISGMLARGETAAAQRTFRAMFSVLALIFGLVTVILFALTYTPGGTLLAPHKVTPQNTKLYLHILRILLVTQFIFVLGGLFSGTLNAVRQFWYSALQPVIYNLGAIILGIALPALFHMGIVSMAWGSLVGAIVGSLFVQVPGIIRNGFSLKPLVDFKDPGLRDVLRTLLPIIFGLSSGQLIALTLPKFFAIGFVGGDITALDNANRLMQVPLAVMAAGPAIALLPTLSILHAEGKTAALRLQLSSSLRRIILLMLLATSLLMALRYPIVHLLLEHGKFNAADTEFTSKVLFCYSFGVLGLGLQQVLARGFYAMRNTLPPVIIGAATMILYCVLAFLVLKVWPIGAMGLAGAAAISLTLLAIAMALTLRRSLGGWDNGKTRDLFLKGLVAAVVAFFAAQFIGGFLMHGLSAYDTDHTRVVVKLLMRLVMLCGGTLAGIATFIIAAILLRIEELGPLQRFVPRRT